MLKSIYLSLRGKTKDDAIRNLTKQNESIVRTDREDTDDIVISNRELPDPLHFPIDSLSIFCAGSLFECLPREIILHIIVLVQDTRSIFALGFTSKWWYCFTTHLNDYWRSAATQLYSNLETVLCMYSWREAWLCNHKPKVIQKVLKEVRSSRKATYVSLNACRVALIPSSFFGCTQLKVVDLTNNYLRFVPKDIGKLVNLETLYLGNNKLVSLPQELFALTKLTKLYLYGNRLMLLPEEITQLKNLNTLALSSNELIEVPMHLRSLKKLKSLTLYDNPLLSRDDLNELGQLLGVDL